VGYGHDRVPFALDGGALCITVDGELVGHWLYLVKPIGVPA
jgi:hypothetical protein